MYGDCVGMMANQGFDRDSFGQIQCETGTSNVGMEADCI